MADGHRSRDAIAQLERAAELDPNNLRYKENLAWMLATVDATKGGDPKRALALAERVCGLLPVLDINQLVVLAAAYAADGRFADAAAIAGRALEMAAARGNERKVNQLRSHIRLYRAGKPYRQ